MTLSLRLVMELRRLSLSDQQHAAMLDLIERVGAAASGRSPAATLAALRLALQRFEELALSRDQLLGAQDLLLQHGEEIGATCDKRRSRDAGYKRGQRARDFSAHAGGEEAQVDQADERPDFPQNGAEAASLSIEGMQNCSSDVHLTSDGSQVEKKGPFPHTPFPKENTPARATHARGTGSGWVFFGPPKRPFAGLATAIGEGWRPDERSFSEAVDRLGLDRAERQLRRFVAHALAAGRVAVDWNAAFRNWADEEVERAGRREKPPASDRVGGRAQRPSAAAVFRDLASKPPTDGLNGFPN